MTRNNVDYVSMTSSQPGLAAYWFVIATICACIVGIWLLTSAPRFADFDTYVLYLDQLVHFPPSNWWYFEALSNFSLLLLKNLMMSVETAVFAAHYLLAITFIIFLVASFPPRFSSWASILFCFCLLGPALAFVTLRATPAYFFVAIATLHAMRRDPRAWLYTLIAFMFHASTLLAILPMALLYFQNYLPDYLRGARFRRLFVLIMIPLLVISIFLPQIPDGIVSIIKNTPYLSKYIAYTGEDTSFNYSVSIDHYLFFLFVCIFSFIFLRKMRGDNVRINMYVLPSFFIYLFIFFSLSPVAAFRQAPFFLLPMISMFPWRTAGLRGPLAFVFVIACAGLFYFQFSQVYI